MFRSFKSLELFRHQVSSRVDRSLREVSNQSNESSDKISSTVFSACFSLVVSFLSQEFINQEKIIKGIIIFALFIVAYIIAYFLYKRISSIIEKICYNVKHHGTEMTERKVKELIDDFDHIACDNNLVGKEFIKNYKREKDLDLKEFYFYELYYYIKVSTDLTLDILSHSDLCINTLTVSTGVDLHRLYNQLHMLISAKNFLLDQIKAKEISLDSNLLLVVISQIDSLSDKLLKIQEECDKFRDQHFSTVQIKALAERYSEYLTQSDP